MTDHQIPKFDPTIYSRIALNDLVTYAVYFLSQSRKEMSAEDIVVACFLLFPKRFALRGYPQWPDATVVNKRWIDCRKRGFISGSTARGFSLTPDGLKVAEKVSLILGGQRPAHRVPTEMRTRAGRFVRELEKSDAFKSFRQLGQQAEISEFDFRSMLLCTMESSPLTLQRNLEQFRQHAALYERNDLLDLLKYCERRFASILSEGTMGPKKYKGGMLKRKLK